MRAYERMLNYVRVHTTSGDAETTPSTACQLVLARQLTEEMTALGIGNVGMDEYGYVYGVIPATVGCEDAPKIGFIAHMDTAPDFSGEGVSPRIIENYDGGSVTLGDSGRVIDREMFPELERLKGRTLIVTDGTTLLGADDKAGIAEIMTAAERLLAGEIPHGQVSIAFTPDEEIGRGADKFDLGRFGADFAYTVDGGEEGQVEYENFNAAAAVVRVSGRSVHPGDAKGKMINAALVAMEFNSMLPAGDTPARTEGREGFFHLGSMSGNVETAELEYIIRDHDEHIFAARQYAMRHIQKLLNEKYGEGTVELDIREQYRNMIEKVRPAMHLIDNAAAAIRAVGLEPSSTAIRGGTDGANLSYKGLPCPNLGTGNYAAHGPYEHITAESMDICTDIIMGIVARYANIRL